MHMPVFIMIEFSVGWIPFSFRLTHPDLRQSTRKKLTGSYEPRPLNFKSEVPTFVCVNQFEVKESKVENFTSEFFYETWLSNLIDSHKFCFRVNWLVCSDSQESVTSSKNVTINEREREKCGGGFWWARLKQQQQGSSVNFDARPRHTGSLLKPIFIRPLRAFSLTTVRRLPSADLTATIGESLDRWADERSRFCLHLDNLAASSECSAGDGRRKGDTYLRLPNLPAKPEPGYWDQRAASEEWAATLGKMRTLRRHRSARALLRARRCTPGTGPFRQLNQKQTQIIVWSYNTRPKPSRLLQVVADDQMALKDEHSPVVLVGCIAPDVEVQ